MRSPWSSPKPRVLLQRFAQREGIDEKAAAKLIDEIDEARENYTKTFADTSRYDARNYDLTINVSPFTTESVAAFLAENIRRKMA